MAGAMRVVINKRFGGFGLSHAATMRYAERKGLILYPEINEISQQVWRKHHPDEELTLDNPFAMAHYYTVPPERYKRLHDECKEQDGNFKRLNATDWYFSSRDVERNDPDLIAVVEELGEKANGSHASLEIVEVPDDVKWRIEEYDGQEWVAEEHRTWA